MLHKYDIIQGYKLSNAWNFFSLCFNSLCKIMLFFILVFQGTGEIQGIVLNLVQPYEARWSTEAFSKTSQVRLLKLCDMNLPCGLNYLPSALKVLDWRGCPLKTLPLSNQLDKIVDLKLPHSKIQQLWHGTKVKTI